MLISIIIPVYNVEPYLRECLDSVFAQDLSDCEVIAVNDGSTDGSRVILETYQSNYPNLLSIIDKANGGLSSARNAGVERAKGDYLYFLDSDDWLKAHAVECLKSTVQKAGAADVIYLRQIFVGQYTGKKVDCHVDIPTMDLKSFYLYAYEHGIGIAPNAVSYLYSGYYWRKAGLHYEEGIKYEDALFKYQLFVREDGNIKAIHVEEPFYVYRTGREGSISTHLTLKNFTDKQYIRKSASRLWTSMGVNDIAYYHMLFDASVFMFYEAWQSEMIKEHNKFWDKEDVAIMRKGVSNKREYGLWLLTKLNPVWMARYYANDLPNLTRRLTNIMLTMCSKLFYH